MNIFKFKKATKLKKKKRAGGGSSSPVKVHAEFGIRNENEGNGNN
eukprot:CAMPEP_0185585278 /NCGR_PEP_ID=MMETSP0434-20130131/37794_1 /TAXON_ID=626734 ORGANISM="Favella taraikaensis, Strain Fe Narragansett Bay" /NCGR_SAMPLE_ID=MMETSP0434 /ASSEMBLY_ACC=CAM_ASM_000379 /LENGTH=44 /DNA_ID= /DNA_START= /DNA_END= /DNA_ORIENTATION=